MSRGRATSSPSRWLSLLLSARAWTPSRPLNNPSLFLWPPVAPSTCLVCVRTSFPPRQNQPSLSPMEPLSFAMAPCGSPPPSSADAGSPKCGLSPTGPSSRSTSPSRDTLTSACVESESTSAFLCNVHGQIRFGFRFVCSHGDIRNPVSSWVDAHPVSQCRVCLRCVSSEKHHVNGLLLGCCRNCRVHFVAKSSTETWLVPRVCLRCGGLTDGAAFYAKASPERIHQWLAQPCPFASPVTASSSD